MRPVSLDWLIDKYSICSLSLLRSCFYHIERMLSAIAKFLVHLWGREGRAEMGESKCRERQWGAKGKGRKWECTKKNSPKTQQIWHSESIAPQPRSPVASGEGSWGLEPPPKV